MLSKIIFGLFLFSYSAYVLFFVFITYGSYFLRLNQFAGFGYYVNRSVLFILAFAFLGLLYQLFLKKYSNKFIFIRNILILIFAYLGSGYLIWLLPVSVVFSDWFQRSIPVFDFLFLLIPIFLYAKYFEVFKTNIREN